MIQGLSATMHNKMKVAHYNNILLEKTKIYFAILLNKYDFNNKDHINLR